MWRLAALFAALASPCSALRLTGGKRADAAPLQCQRGGRPANELAVGGQSFQRGGGRFDGAMESLLRPSGEDEAIACWRGGQVPLSRHSLEQASAPHGHTGALLRLRRALAAKLVERSPNQTLTIVTLGGSLTVGTGVKVAWPWRLERLALLLEFPVKVVNLATRATTSKWAISQLSRWSGVLEAADVVLVDYSINDEPGGTGGIKGRYSGGRGEVAAAFKELMALLIGLPSKPAVMALETIFAPGKNPRCSEAYKTDVRKFVHWDVERELRIPTISYALATCPSGSLQWFGHGKFWIHPNDTTHDLIARTVLGSFLLQMDVVAGEGLEGAEDHPALRPDPVSACLAAPISAYTAYAKGEFVPSARDGAWQFAEDVRGKPGWIVPKSAPYSEIAFSVVTRVGWVQVEFLGSYEGVGRVDVWIDSWRNATCLLDGLWDQRASQSRLSLMKVRLPPGYHTLRFGSRGDKFKILGIVSC